MMEKAYKLLDQEEVAAADQQTQISKDSKAALETLPDGLKSAVSFLLEAREPAEGLVDMHTSAETEAIRLAQEVRMYMSLCMCECVYV